jgi:hypothetical protein
MRTVILVAVVYLVLLIAFQTAFAQSHRGAPVEIAARLLSPIGKGPFAKDVTFRSVAMRIPWVYVLNRTGSLYIFQVSKNDHEKLLNPTKVMDDLGDGNDLKIVDDVLICTCKGALQVYSLKNPGEPRALGRFGPEKEYASETIVCHSKLAFVICKSSILSYDVSTPSKPKFLGANQANGYGWTGFVSERYLYVGEIRLNGTGRQGISIYDVSEPTQIKEVAFVSTTRAPYHIFGISPTQVLTSLEGDSRPHVVTPDNITVNGNSAWFNTTKASQPVLVKEFSEAGGTPTTVLTSEGKEYLVCQGVVFSIEMESLKRCFSFQAGCVSPDHILYHGTTLDATPYHGTSDGMYAALPLGDVTIVLRRTGN